MVTAPRVDLLIDGAWTQADVRYEGPGGRSVIITRDRPNEMARFRASECTFTLGNTDGRYSPRKPNSPYYGHLTRNLPVRVVRAVSSEAFGVDVADGWPAGFTAGAGFATDYDVTGGVGTMSTGVIATNYHAFVTSMVRLDSLARVTVTPGAVATGAAVRMGALVRYADTENHYAADVRFGLSGVANVQLSKLVANVETVLATSATTLTYDANTSVTIECVIEAGYLHARASTTADTSTVVEVSATDTSLTAAGSCGVRARRDTSNSNGTLVVEFDDFAVEDVRFAGEIPSLAPQSDGTGTDSWLAVGARSAMERLSDSGRDKSSAPYRWLSARSAAPPVACWPLEEGSNAEEGWPLYGRSPLRPWSGTHPSGAVVTLAKFGKGDLAPWLPDAYSWSGSDGISILSAQVESPGFVAADGWTIDLIVNIPGDSGELFVDVNPSYLGGVSSWPQLTLDPTGGGVVLVAMNGEPETSTAVPALYDGNAHHVRWHAYADGGDVSWTVAVDGTTQQTDTTAGAMTLTAISFLGLGSAAQSGTRAAAGYVAVWEGDPPTGGTAAYAAHAGETPDERLERVAGEEGIAYAPSLATASADTMGPQPTDTAGAIIEEVEAVDLGMLYDLRSIRGVGLRSRVSTLAQASALTLDHSAGELSAPLVPTDGMSAVANDVTARSPYGGQRRHTVTDGPLGTANPEDGGVGTRQRPVESNVTDDSVLEYIAAWVAALGTVDAPQLPEVEVGLHRPEAVSLIDSTLAVRTGDIVAISNPPSSLLPPDTLTGMVVGSSERWDQFEHSVSFTLAPDVVQSGVGLWDDTSARWDSQVSTLASAFTTGTDTTMSVAVESGKHLWATGTGGAVSYVGVATDDSGSATQTTFTPGWPAAYTPTDGDDALLFLHFGGNSLTATDPSGWTDWPGVTNPVTEGTASRAYAWYRRITAADSDPTITVSGSATGIATLVVVRDGVAAGAGAQIGENGSATAAGTSLDLPTLTGVATGSMVVAFVSARVATGTAIPSGVTPDASYTERSDVATSRNTATAQNVRQSANTRAITAGATLSGDTFSVDQTSSMVAFAMEILAEPDSTSEVFPFDIGAGGARLTVTNITGATSPQAFTITQTPVNGIIKTVPAGSKVSLWAPARWSY